MRKGRSRIIRLPEIDPHTPLQDQLTAHLRGLILSGAIAPDARLPAQRALAQELKVSRNTVIHAYEALHAEGLVTGKTGAGTFVAAQPGKAKSHRRKPIEASALPAMLPLEQGPPDLSLFPIADWTRLQNRRWRTMSADALGYGDAAGWLGLRFILSQRVAAIRGVKCAVEQIHIVPSTLAGIRLTAAALGLSRKKVFVESPCHKPVRASLESAGALIEALAVDEHGADTTGLLDRTDGAAAYLTPSCQFPTGAPLSEPRRKAAINWARNTDAWIIEDDYESDFAFEGAAPAPLASESTRVIYSTSLNNLLFPALRLAFLVVPEVLVDRFNAARAMMDPHSDIPRQMVAHDFLEGGYMAAHIRRCREVYAERRDVLRRALATDFAESLRLAQQPVGLHVTAWMKPGSDDEAFCHQAAARGVVVHSISSCTHGPKRSPPGIYAGFSGYPARTIEKAVRAMAPLAKSIMQTS